MMSKNLFASLLAALCLSALAPPVFAGDAFDVDAATQAYLDRVPADVKANSDAYFEGGYWLVLVDFILGAALSLFLLAGKWSARMRNLAERISGRRAIQTFLYWCQYVLATTIILFPITIYEGYFREHKYGFSNQTLGEWLGDQGKGLLLDIFFGGILVTVLYGVFRRVQRNWWILGAVIMTVFMAFMMFIGPVFIAPMFNKYTKLTDPTFRDPILKMARANSIDADDVWIVDESRQSNRISANVSGLWGTERISLNDNLLNRCSLAEIKSVMGHEMGHYVMNHVQKSFLFFFIVIAAGFAFLKWSFNWVVKRKGKAWDIRGVGDTAGLPLFVLLISVYFFLLTPITNSFIRTQESEADLFGLNVSRQPDGHAEVELKVGEYRKLDPGPIEEIFFFDHPSSRKRIKMAMRWKVENM
jgi:STE24 endopeptidase